MYVSPLELSVRTSFVQRRWARTLYGRVRKPHALLRFVLIIVVAKEVINAIPRVHEVPKCSFYVCLKHALARVTLADHGVHELELDIPGDGRSDGQEDELSKGHGFEVVVIRSRRGLDRSEGEEILDERTSVGHVGIDAFG